MIQIFTSSGIVMCFCDINLCYLFLRCGIWKSLKRVDIRPYLGCDTSLRTETISCARTERNIPFAASAHHVFGVLWRYVRIQESVNVALLYMTKHGLGNECLERHCFVLFWKYTEWNDSFNERQVSFCFFDSVMMSDVFSVSSHSISHITFMIQLRLREV